MAKSFSQMEIESKEPEKKMFLMYLKPVGLTRLNIIVIFLV